MDGLNRYRSKGQQIARVERVNVESGGQAVVGNLQHRSNPRSSDEAGRVEQGPHKLRLLKERQSSLVRTLSTSVFTLFL